MGRRVRDRPGSRMLLGALVDIWYSGGEGSEIKCGRRILRVAQDDKRKGKDRTTADSLRE
jgi:hypothetical protein